jgi:hypothetical protein
MTRELQDRDNLHHADQKFLSDIEAYGWNVTTVFAKEGEIGPEWAYSTGLFHVLQHPEIVIFGLELSNMQKIINNIGTEVKGGRRFEPGNEYHDIFAKCGCQFRRLDRNYYRDYLGWAVWFYEGDAFPVLQCFWPDREGHYPWDPACAAASVQPLLFNPS